LRKRILVLIGSGVVILGAVAGSRQSAVRAADPRDGPVGTSPIQHIVVIYQENHSFDNVLGAFCVTKGRCQGASTGTISTGATIPLTAAPDVVPAVDHSVTSQELAINGGAMNQFDLLTGCSQAENYACYSTYLRNVIPNVWKLADGYALSDQTFEPDIVSSWGAHIELVAATLDDFTGDNPVFGNPPSKGPGWGCDSYREAPWQDPDTGEVSNEPSCIPDVNGNGPWRTSPVSYVPTIMDRLDGAGLTWKIYASHNPPGQPLKLATPYGWAICPTFAECLYGAQAANMVDTGQILTDAATGLPTLSIVLPDQKRSQHNSDSMIKGDNWIGQVVKAIQSGPSWSTTAIFVTWDDCGCFYDHVPPPPGLGVRVPMVIVSPYAIPGFTDSTVASFASLLAFTEHTFGLEPLSNDDATAYDYSGSFNYDQPPRLAPVHLASQPVPAASLRYIRAHPPDEDDPT